MCTQSPSAGTLTNSPTAAINSVFHMAQEEQHFSTIIDKLEYLIQNSPYLNGNMRDLIYGSIWHDFHVLSFPQCHVSRRPEARRVNRTLTTFKARRSSRSPRLCCLTCLLTRLHCCRLEPSPSLSLYLVLSASGRAGILPQQISAE